MTVKSNRHKSKKMSKRMRKELLEAEVSMQELHKAQEKAAKEQQDVDELLNLGDKHANK